MRRVVVVGSQDVFDGVGAVFEDLSEDEGVAVEYVCEAGEFVPGGTAIGATCL